ncbi:FRG domain-containing protein [Chryseobacterium sp. NRRL B-14798]|uniref:FRG domain-containing protein n=1 Tax=Chryseobacterium sp. NRRL B-14798 TaxID=3162880 RepID=UPI003D1E8F01
MILEVAKNITEYTEMVSKYNSHQVNNWYRGMSKSSYSLEPSLFREKREIGIHYSGREINGRQYRKSEAVMKSDLAAIDKFMNHYQNKFPDKSKDYNLIDFLYIMQHYDIPTRLLDFTKNPKIALYFSVSNASEFEDWNSEDEIESFYESSGYSEEGSSIHIVNPKLINDNTNLFKNLKDDILKIYSIDLDTLHNLTFPICVKTDNQDARIISQEGVFMLFGRDYKAIDEYEILHNDIVKIFIPRSCRYQIKKELKEQYNISHITMYPDIKGIAIEIIEEIEAKYKRDCQSIFGK